MELGYHELRLDGFAQKISTAEIEIFYIWSRFLLYNSIIFWSSL